MRSKWFDSKRFMWSQKRWLLNSSEAVGASRLSTVSWYHSAKARLLCGQMARLTAARVRLRIPRISATQSTGMLPPSPEDFCHRFHANVATPSTAWLPPSEQRDAGSDDEPGFPPLVNGGRTCCTLFRGVATRAADALPIDETGSKTAGQRRIALVPRSNATLGMPALRRWSFGERGRPFAHGVALEGNLVRVVDQPVKDSIGQGRFANRLMPVLDRQLAGDDRGPAVMAIFEEF